MTGAEQLDTVGQLLTMTCADDYISKFDEDYRNILRGKERYVGQLEPEYPEKINEQLRELNIGEDPSVVVLYAMLPLKVDISPSAIVWMRKLVQLVKNGFEVVIIYNDCDYDDFAHMTNHHPDNSTRNKSLSAQKALWITLWDDDAGVSEFPRHYLLNNIYDKIICSHRYEGGAAEIAEITPYFGYYGMTRADGKIPKVRQEGKWKAIPTGCTKRADITEYQWAFQTLATILHDYATQQENIKIRLLLTSSVTTRAPVQRVFEHSHHGKDRRNEILSKIYDHYDNPTLHTAEIPVIYLQPLEANSAFYALTIGTDTKVPLLGDSPDEIGKKIRAVNKYLVKDFWPGEDKSDGRRSADDFWKQFIYSMTGVVHDDSPSAVNRMIDETVKCWKGVKKQLDKIEAKDVTNRLKVLALAGVSGNPPSIWKDHKNQKNESYDRTNDNYWQKQSYYPETFVLLSYIHENMKDALPAIPNYWTQIVDKLRGLGYDITRLKQAKKALLSLGWIVNLKEVDPGRRSELHAALNARGTPKSGAVWYVLTPSYIDDIKINISKDELLNFSWERSPTTIFQEDMESVYGGWWWTPKNKEFCPCGSGDNFAACHANTYKK